MTAEAPPFWWQPPDWRAWLLYPVSGLYGTASKMRMEMAKPKKAAIPVLCVGNLTVGGAGKTPVALALAKEAKRQGLKPGFLTRGHGGGVRHPRLVDPAADTVWHSGDEPLLLARVAPTAVTPKRAAGVPLLVDAGCDFAIMDDGFQSARLHADYSLLVVDARRGIGNGHVIPGGPMRAPLLPQLRRATAVLRLGEGEGADDVVRAASRAGRPIHVAKTQTVNPRKFAGKRFYAFAGIGDPDKFFDTLRRTGAEVVETRRFGDHHVYLNSDIEALEEKADATGLQMVTTAKDAARFTNGTPVALRFLERLSVLEIETVFDPPDVASRIVAETLENFRRRRFSN